MRRVYRPVMATFQDHVLEPMSGLAEIGMWGSGKIIKKMVKEP